MQIVKLNLIPGGVLPVCFASQHDTGRVIRFMLFEGENVFTLSGAETIALRLQKPDGSELVESVTNTGADYVDVVTTADTCDTAGASVGEIVITDGGDVLGSANFGLFVESDAFEGGGIVTQTASGPIATFETNIETAFVSLKSDINPVQDLHGYSKPWSGGGGKNKLENTSTVTSLNSVTFTKNEDGSVKLTGTASAAINSTYINFFTLPSGTYIFTDGTTSTNCYLYLLIEGSGTWYKNGDTFTVDGNTRTRVVAYVANGSATNLTLYPMIRLASVSDASFEPYSNICPISGFSALNVTRTGKNLADFLSHLRETDYGLTISATSDGAIHYEGTATQGYCQLTFPFNLSIPSGTTITVSRDVSLSYQHYFSLTFTDNSVEYVRIMPNTTSTTYTLPKDLAKIDIVCLNLIVGTAYNETVKFMIELGNQASEYHAYNGQTATVNFGQTVYGGSLDVTNGKLTITHGFVNLGDLSWSGSNGEFYSGSLTSTIKKGVSGHYDVCISDTYNAANKATLALLDNGEISVDTAGYIQIKDTSFTSASTFKSTMASTQLVYELATPIEITTTPENLTAIVGVNNVYADTNGDTEVEYYIEV